MKKNYVKMSKSQGNGISVDAIVKGIYRLDPKYIFCDTHGRLVDWAKEHIYFQKGQGYLTLRGQVVFLHEKNNPVPAFLTTLTTVQHENEFDFWLNLLRKYAR